MTQHRPIYIVLAGLPGSGKTTLRNEILAEWNADARGPMQVLSTDDFIERMALLPGNTYSEAFQAAISDAEGYLRQTREGAIRNGADILHDQTNATVKSRLRRLDGLPSSYVKVAIVCHVAEPVRQERLLNRPGKVIPPEADRFMREMWTPPTCAEGFDVVTAAFSWRDVLQGKLHSTR